MEPHEIARMIRRACTTDGRQWDVSALLELITHLIGAMHDGEVALMTVAWCERRMKQQKSSSITT